jgi:predicted nucleic acid-binding Zn ribbon protein
MADLIRLQWTRYPDGFKIVEDWTRPHTLSTLLSKGMPSDPGPLGYLVPINPKRRDAYVLEGIDAGVFLDLANVHSNDDVLAFAKQWGVLSDVHNMHGADVTRVQGRAIAMRVAIDWAQLGKGVDLDEILAKWDLQPELRMRWARLAGDSAPRFFLEPRDLFAFCVAELCQRVQGDTKIRSCPRCGKLFMLGTIGQQRGYCSDACRVAMHRKRKREREQRVTKSPHSRGNR